MPADMLVHVTACVSAMPTCHLSWCTSMRPVQSTYLWSFQVSDKMCRATNGRRSGVSGGLPWAGLTSGLKNGPRTALMYGMRNGEKSTMAKAAVSSSLTRYILSSMCPPSTPCPKQVSVGTCKTLCDRQHYASVRVTKSMECMIEGCNIERDGSNVLLGMSLWRCQFFS